MIFLFFTFFPLNALSHHRHSSRKVISITEAIRPKKYRPMGHCFGFDILKGKASSQDTYFRNSDESEWNLLSYNGRNQTLSETSNFDVERHCRRKLRQFDTRHKNHYGYFIFVLFQYIYYQNVRSLVRLRISNDRQGYLQQVQYTTIWCRRWL